MQLVLHNYHFFFYLILNTLLSFLIRKTQPVLIGAGVKGGYVAGETNKTASKVTKDPYTISDINATIAHLLGIEAEKERFSPTGRPFKVANKGEVIKDILA